MTELSHSYSSIKLFENCPLRFYEQRVTKSVKDEGGVASIHGDRVHKSLEAKLKGQADLPQDMAEYEPLVNAVVANIGNGSLEIEKEITINKLMRETGWWDKDAWLRSKFDILAIKTDTAYVFDWKTGKRKNADPFQLRLFAAQVMLRYPDVTSVQTALVWLKERKLDVEVYHRKDVTSLWSEILTRIQRIEDAKRLGVWPAKPSGLCPYCPLFKTCAYAKR